MQVKRVLIQQDPFIHPSHGRSWREQGNWPAYWIDLPEMSSAPFVGAFRHSFVLDSPAQIRCHVSADERYQLFLNGRRVGRGPEKGDPFNWFYESYQLELPAGQHTLVAQVWALGDLAPLSQMSVCPGFLFAAEAPFTELLSTGLAFWEAKLLAGYRFRKPLNAHLREHMPDIDGFGFDWGYAQGLGDNWQKARILRPGMGKHLDWDYYKCHWLAPATLPPMREQNRTLGKVRHVSSVDQLETQEIPVCGTGAADEIERWQAFIEGQSDITVAPHRGYRVIVDLQDYICAYPELLVSEGCNAQVRIYWAESLRHEASPFVFNKGHRDEIEGKFFVGVGNTFTIDGALQRCFEPLWWQAGRYLEIVVLTQDAPLIMQRLSLHETGYPLEMESHFEADGLPYGLVLPILSKGITASAHETFEDSPYFEQLQYTGDTRLESLCVYVMSRDARLPRKAIRLYDSSRLAKGLTQARYPCRESQLIPGFALWWLAMVHDYAHWRDDLSFVKSLMPGVRATAEAFLRYRAADGLIQGLEGWNVVDWVPSWDAGIPPEGLWGASAVSNWHYVYALALLADLEEKLGQQTLASYYRQQAKVQAEASLVFWNEDQGLLADDLEHRFYSEHTQCLALLSGYLPEDKTQRVLHNLISNPHLARASIYFSHYLLETFYKFAQSAAFEQRLQQWFALPQQGFKAPPERDHSSRSDCHGWSSHPLYHCFASILGIRPASLGFAEIVIRPQLGSLTRAAGRLVHPRGFIEVAFERQGQTLQGQIILPAGLEARLELAGEQHVIRGTYRF